MDLAAARCFAGDGQTAQERQLLRAVQRVHPREFEEMVGALAWRIGFKDVVVTPYSQTEAWT